MSIKARINGLRGQARQRWQALAPRERRAVALAAAVLGSFFCWQVLVAPALTRIEHWNTETPKLRSQAQALDALLGQRPADLAGALAQTLDEAGLRAHSQLDAEGDGWHLAWRQAPAEPAMAWLQHIPPRLGLTIGQLSLRRDPGADTGPVTFSGTLRMDQAHGAKDPS